MAGNIYLVATPIGNLQDITLRALEVLRSVDVIACEDTRHTRKLLNHFGIANKLVSYHEHNEETRSNELLNAVMDGRNVAVVSDAGTPGINDPGFVIARKAREAGLSVVPVPGACALVAAAGASGLATDSIFFGGFLPSRRSERLRRLEKLSEIQATLVFYESPHRIGKSLTDCADVLGDRQAVVARELTKVHEQFLGGTLKELAGRFLESKTKGELVVLIERGSSNRQAAAPDVSLEGRIAQLEADGIDHKAALKKAAAEFGLSKSEAYRLVHGQKRNQNSEKI